MAALDQNPSSYETALARISRARAPVVARIAEAYPAGRGLGIADPAHLTALGCTRAQAERIVSAYQLVRAADALQARDGGSTVRSPTCVERYLRARIPAADLEVERFYVLALNARQHPLALFVVAQGSVAQVDVHPREVFRPLIRVAAHSAILAHNHPSGDPEPSTADIDLTARLVDVGRMIGIPVLDHLVLAGSDCRSLAAMGFMP